MDCRFLTVSPLHASPQQPVPQAASRNAPYFPLAALLAAQRAFMAWESLARAAALIFPRPPDFDAAAFAGWLRLALAHRARCAAAIRSLASALMVRFGEPVEAGCDDPVKSRLNSFWSEPILSCKSAA